MLHGFWLDKQFLHRGSWSDKKRAKIYMTKFSTESHNRDLKQMVTATSTVAVVDAESWRKYVTLARQNFKFK